MTRVSVKAVFIGTVVDIVLSLVGTISLAMGLLIGGSENPAWFTTTGGVEYSHRNFRCSAGKAQNCESSCGQNRNRPDRLGHQQRLLTTVRRTSRWQRTHLNGKRRSQKDRL